MIPAEVHEWLRAGGFGQVTTQRPVGGGCINNGASLKTTSGRSFFLKTNHRAPIDMFAREAEGLTVLRVDNRLALPEPYLWGESFLLMEDLAPAPRRPDYWSELGRRLAGLHQYTNPRFGFGHDNYIGSTPQPNAWTEDGYRFFGEQRLLFQAHLAQRNALLEPGDIQRVENLIGRLPSLVPAQPAALIHGDLWGGNAITDAHGDPALIDPAAHFGWAEAELAMTALFGAFPEPFYRSYQEIYPLEPDFRQRFDIYNLYHLLNHLNLFGSGYYGEVIGILRKYA